MEYRKLGKIFSRLTRLFPVDVLSIERPFLYIIAQWIGAIKMWSTGKNQRSIVGWSMVGSSQARKIVLGSGVVPKEGVLSYAIQYTGDNTLVQHQADAILYAHAYLAKPSLQEVTRDRHRNTKKYRAWRDGVIARDGRSCQRCQKKNLWGKKLQVHHIISVLERPDLQYSIKNGEVLCIPCHSSHEHLGRKKPAGFGAKVSLALTGIPKTLEARASMKRAWKRRRLGAPAVTRRKE